MKNKDFFHEEIFIYNYLLFHEEIFHFFLQRITSEMILKQILPAVTIQNLYLQTIQKINNVWGLNNR